MHFRQPDGGRGNKQDDLGQPWNAPESAQNVPEPLYYPPGGAPLNQPHEPLIKAGKVV